MHSRSTCITFWLNNSDAVIFRDFDDPGDPDVVPAEINQPDEIPLDDKPKRGRGRPAKYPVGVSTAATILTTMASTGVNPGHHIVQIIQENPEKDVARPHMCGICQRRFKEVGGHAGDATQKKSLMAHNG